MIDKNSSTFEFIRQNVEVRREILIEQSSMEILVLDWSEEIRMEYTENSRDY